MLFDFAFVPEIPEERILVLWPNMTYGADVWPDGWSQWVSPQSGAGDDRGQFGARGIIGVMDEGRLRPTAGAADPYRLERFVTAQDSGGTYQRAVTELRAGAKVSHWMWFVFPQVAGLGMSAASQEYAIAGLAEARAYLGHPVLGPRLLECAGVLAGTEGKTANTILGPVDAMKLRSSMTLFAAVDPDQTVFGTVLRRYFGGVPDEATLARL